MVFVNSRLINGGVSSSLDDSDRALNALRAWRSETCVLREQSICVIQEFETQKKLLNSFLTIRGKSAGNQEMWAVNLLLLFQCLIRVEIEDEKLALLRYMECVPSSDEVQEVLSFECLQ